MVHIDRLRFKFFLIALLSSFFCISQGNRTYFHEMNIAGVPFNKGVNVLFEDSVGFLWIGTNNGLYRYDGHELLAYRYDVFDLNSIPNNSINSIVEDNYQNLWIGSESYLVCFNRKQQTFKGYYKNSTLGILGKSEDGNIWADRGNTSLIKIIPHKNVDSVQFDTHFNYDSNRKLTHPNKPINSFVQDDFGRYWFATMDGIFSFGKDYRVGASSFDKSTVVLKAATNNTLLALTNDTIYVLGYRKENRKLQILETYSNFKGSTQRDITPTSLAISPIDQTLWVGTTYGLVKGIRTENNYIFDYIGPGEETRGGLRDHRINSVIVDHYGNLWIGSPKGINKYVGRNSIFEYQRIQVASSSETPLASSLYFDKNERIWAGVNNDGLYRVIENRMSKVYSTEKRFGVIKGDYQNKELFIGTGQALLKSRNIDFQRAKVQFDTIKKYSENVMDILSISEEETWVGLWVGGIDIINDVDGLSNFKKDIVAELMGNHVSVMLMDKNKNIWVGTRGQGLYKIDLIKEEFYHFLPVETTGLSSNAILSLLEDGDKIWIGTRGGGLNIYDQTKGGFESYGESQGLKSLTISSIQRDKAGNIWVSTQNGLARFDVKQERFVNFGVEDGVMESQFAFNSSTANTDKGILYFGCSDGFYTVHTEKFKQTAIKPQTVISGFKTLGAEKHRDKKQGEHRSSRLSLVSGKEIRLPYDTNNIAIEFSSLDLTAPHKNEYAYMLEGMNDYWVYTTASNRNANYNDLPPGEYTFKVKSSNSDGVWNENPTELSFLIAAPWWRSDLAYISYILLVLMSIWVSAILVRRWYRMKKNLVAETVSRQKDNQHNRMKMVFFTDISHELRTPLTLIQGAIEKVIRQNHFTLSSLTAQRLHNNSLRMGSLITQIMDIRKFDVGEFRVKAAEGNIVEDILKIKNAFNDFAKIYHIRYSLEIQHNNIKAWYDSEILEKILFNLLSNAFKYTPEHGEIHVDLTQVTIQDNDPNHKELQSGKYIECAVRDNGVGIAKEDIGFIFDRYYQSGKLPTNQVPGTGIGMELVQKLLDRHHGSINVESEENVYTKFTFMLPIQKRHYKTSEISVAKAPSDKEMKISSESLLISPADTSFADITVDQNPMVPKVLLVEDNDELRAMLKEELAPDFCVLESSNGKEGYAMAVSEQPQLIISDILMPFEDGISMLKRLKKKSDISHIPVIMLTARDSYETKIECLSMGADDFIEKPFSLEYVKWKVKNMLLARKQLEEKYSKVITAEPSEIEVVSNDEKFVGKLIRIIEDYIDDDLLSVEFLASEVGMSRANLYRKTQAILHDTPVNLIKKTRLKRAAQFLRGNNMYISEIAYRTGFNNQKYFSKCFSKQYGESPTDYAKKYSDEKDGKNNLSEAVKNFI